MGVHCLLVTLFALISQIAIGLRYSRSVFHVKRFLFGHFTTTTNTINCKDTLRYRAQMRYCLCYGIAYIPCLLSQYISPSICIRGLRCFYHYQQGYLPRYWIRYSFSVVNSTQHHRLTMLDFSQPVLLYSTQYQR